MELLKFLESIRTPFLDAVLGLISRLGEETVGLVILCLIFWCISKQIAYCVGISFFLAGLTVQGMKICFRIPRPWIIDTSLNPVPSALKHATGYSFPSGHTQNVAAVFGSLGAQIKQIPVKTVCFLLVFLVAFSRMYLGVHTLLDVSVSLLITLLLVLVTVKFIVCDTVNKKRELTLTIFMMLYAVAVLIISSILYTGGKIEQSNLSDCLKAAGAGIGFAAGMYIERVYINFSVGSKNVFWQVLKFILGIAGILIIKEGIKLIAGSSLVVDAARYFLLLQWVTVFFPLIIKRFFRG